MKLFLREAAVQYLSEEYEGTMGNNITSVNSPEELTRNCFSKPCILAILNTRKKVRSEQ